MTPRTALATLLVALALAPSTAPAQPLGHIVETGETPWPENALGQPMPVDGVRPPSLGALRSMRAPVSVHLGPGVDASLAPRVLTLAERTLDALEFTHRFPLPQPDGTRGGDPSLDLYLTADGAPY